MRARGRRPKAFVVVGALLLGALVLLPGVASASGGGGCGQPVTDERTAGVDIEDF